MDGGSGELGRNPCDDGAGMVPARKNHPYPGAGQESEGGASEAIFLAGENHRVLTRLARIAQSIQYGRQCETMTSSPFVCTKDT